MQTSYSQYMGSAYPGLVADVQFANVIVTKSLETATIYPGLVVSRGTDKDRQVVLGGTDPIGVVVRSLDQENNASDLLQYVATDTIGVMSAGVIWANVAGTGNPGDALKYNTTTGVIGLGAVGGGEQLLNGRLDSAQTVSAALARIVLIDPAAAVTYLQVIPVTITTQPTAQTAADGNDATFTVVAAGDPTITYQWEVSEDSGVSWAEISGATSASYVRTVATADDGFEFRVQVTNDYGTVASDEVALTVT